LTYHIDIYILEREREREIGREREGERGRERKRDIGMKIEVRERDIFVTERENRRRK
jgi:hypothetical protein